MIDQGAKAELLGAVCQLHEYIAKMNNDIVTKSADNCLNCENFDEDSEVCSKYKARPPARTIAEGCESWDLDIPF